MRSSGERQRHSTPNGKKSCTYKTHTGFSAKSSNFCTPNKGSTGFNTVFNSISDSQSADIVAGTSVSLSFVAVPVFYCLWRCLSFTLTSDC